MRRALELLKEIIKSGEYSRIIEELSLEERITFLQNLDENILEMFDGKESKFLYMLSFVLTEDEAQSYINDNNENLLFKYLGYFSSSDDMKIKLADSVLRGDEKDLTETEVIDIVATIKDDKLKIDWLINHDSLRSTSISRIISGIKDDDVKLQLTKKYEGEFSGFTIRDIIISIDNFERKKKMIELYKTILGSEEIGTIIASMESFEEKKAIINTFVFDEYAIASIIENTKNFDQKKMLLVEYKDIIKTDSSNIKKIIKSTDILTEQIILMHSFEKKEGLNEYFEIVCPNFRDIGSVAKEELSQKVLRIIEKYKGAKPSISDLKSLIAKQAEINFGKNRGIDQNRNTGLYLPSGLPEILNNIAGTREFSGLLSNPEFLKYYSKMTGLIGESYNVKSVADVFRTIIGRSDDRLFDINDMKYYQNKMAKEPMNKKGETQKEFENKKEESQRKMQELAHELGVESLTVDECKLVGFLFPILNIKDPLLKRSYFEAIKEVLQEEDKELSQLFLNISTDNQRKEKSIEFQKIFELATQKVMRKAIEDKDRAKEGGLLTQLSTYTLNIEKAKEEAKELKKLETSIIKELLLTTKGKEKINIERVKSIINSDEELLEIFNSDDKRFDEKMLHIFSKLYPEYIGKRSLEALYGLMQSDSRYKEKLSKPITLEEKSKLPLQKEYFEIDKELQKEKLIVSILNAINTEELDPGSYALNPKIAKKLEVLEKSIDLMLESKEPGKDMGLLIFEDLSLGNFQNVANLLLFYESIKTSTNDKDVEAAKRPLTVDNLEKYANRAEIMSLRGSKYPCVLRKKVIDILEPEHLKENYDHYLEMTSKRTYRTIPDINGKFESNGKTLTYRSYDIDDPEQLIAGARMTKDVKTSCFQIGHAQDGTLRYITSSPNGIIVAVEDEKNEFLGRVYGYRVGNVVHFTRMYYNVPFDFEAAVERIGQDIIDGSKEIDYVTCIPEASKPEGVKYTTKNIVEPPENIDITQEGQKLYTDHPERKISIIASRHPVLNPEEVKFETREIGEKFYKKREESKEIDPSTISPSSINSDESEKQFEAVSNIIFRSDCKEPHALIDSLSTCNQIVLSEDYVIVQKDDELLVSKIDYGESPEAKEYSKLVDQEIIREAKRMEAKRKGNEEEQLETKALYEKKVEELQLGGEKALDDLTREELEMIQRKMNQIHEQEETQNLGGR